MRENDTTNDHRPYLTRGEALRITATYSHLAGQPYYEGDNLLGTIECVAIAPYDPINKWLFIHYYADCRHPTKALGFYRVPYYDIILIIYTVNNGLTYRNLDHYHGLQQKVAG